MTELTTHFMLSLRDRAGALIEANDKVLDAYRKGEDDPMTGHFKAVSMTYSAAEKRFIETATPEVVLALVNRIFELSAS